MGTMVVAKPFNLTRNDGTMVRYEFGVHENVPDGDVAHPYAQHFLAPNGRLPEPSAASPLTHEERVAMKASLDAAEGRVRVAEGESKAARDERDDLSKAHRQAVADLAVAQARIASLETDLDKATKPAAVKPATAPAK